MIAMIRSISAMPIYNDHTKKGNYSRIRPDPDEFSLKSDMTGASQFSQTGHARRENLPERTQ